MVSHLLFEAASGYAIFETHGLDEIGQNIQEEVRDSVNDLNRFGKIVKLFAFQPFESTHDALSECNSISEGIMTDNLRNFLDFNFPEKSRATDLVLGLADSKLGASIFEETKLPCRSDEFVLELIRGVRMHFLKFMKDLKQI
ncbi:nucleolar protein 56-like [Silene latifolia]|uniref:nucleolar protein 56-like n=1 Tax=Silene latifolia TaxID=37657 RepID=UPI003D7720AA